MRRIALLLLVLLSSLPLAAATRRVAEIRFLTGIWTMTQDGIVWDEQWTSPRGDGILGMCRGQKDGKTFFYELLAIEQEESGPVLKLKHFSHGLVGWEEKGVAVLLPLVSLTEKEAVFEQADKAVRLTYRLESKNRLYAVLEKWKDGKQLPSNEFRYTRAK